MYPNPWGPPWSMPYMGPMGGTDEAVKMAKAILKEHKAEKRKKIEDEKKKEAKGKPRTFTLLEIWGIMLLGSIPLTLMQISLLNQVQIYLSTIFNAPHP